MGSISTLVPKFELKEAESIAPSVKMTIFPTNFDRKLVKMGSISTLVPKFEWKEAEPITPSVKMTFFLTNFDRK